ncbi:MAG: hypothetical protein SGARI_003820 [Bacillariaceae sp.]
MDLDEFFDNVSMPFSFLFVKKIQDECPFEYDMLVRRITQHAAKWEKDNPQAPAGSWANMFDDKAFRRMKFVVHPDKWMQYLLQTHGNVRTEKERADLNVKLLRARQFAEFLYVQVSNSRNRWPPTPALLAEAHGLFGPAWLNYKISLTTWETQREKYVEKRLAENYASIKADWDRRAAAKEQKEAEEKLRKEQEFEARFQEMQARKEHERELERQAKEEEQRKKAEADAAAEAAARAETARILEGDSDSDFDDELYKIPTFFKYQDATWRDFAKM